MVLTYFLSVWWSMDTFSFVCLTEYLFRSNDATLEKFYYIINSVTQDLRTAHDCIFKPGFHMSGKSQTIGDFVVSRPSQTFPTQGDNGTHLPRRVFKSREHLGRSGNNKFPDGLGFSRHHENQALDKELWKCFFLMQNYYCPLLLCL